MDDSEGELISQVRLIKYRRISNNIQQQIKNDRKKLKIAVYKMSPNKYKQKLHQEVVEHYQKTPLNLKNDLNKEVKTLVSKLKVKGRIEKYNIKRCFITLKDHKSDSQTNPTCRLINPSKSQIGKISKIILQDNCATLRIALNINQWCSTVDCIKWFNNLDKNDKCSFIKYDIREYYLSIMEKAVNGAKKLAKEYPRIK